MAITGNIYAALDGNESEAYAKTHSFSSEGNQGQRVARMTAQYNATGTHPVVQSASVAKEPVGGTTADPEEEMEGDVEWQTVGQAQKSKTVDEVRITPEAQAIPEVEQTTIKKAVDVAPDAKPTIKEPANEITAVAADDFSAYWTPMSIVETFDKSKQMDFDELYKDWCEAFGTGANIAVTSEQSEDIPAASSPVEEESFKIADEATEPVNDSETADTDTVPDYVDVSGPPPDAAETTSVIVEASPSIALTGFDDTIDHQIVLDLDEMENSDSAEKLPVVEFSDATSVSSVDVNELESSEVIPAPSKPVDVFPSTPLPPPTTPAEPICKAPKKKVARNWKHKKGEKPANMFNALPVDTENGPVEATMPGDEAKDFDDAASETANLPEDSEVVTSKKKTKKRSKKGAKKTQKKAEAAANENCFRVEKLYPVVPIVIVAFATGLGV
ncbi:hypothetical protein EJ02DRAFT_470472 [Clathrospora elynae]|uniref:Uncharacterized protein n=1 Tax=Clathrospora elynae TaxID=706981 RepID=A0A6A5SA96_9PLEO|nr:hypothetical protein EJ02DRAFT_470472 [Clathrospora elynae]